MHLDYQINPSDGEQAGVCGAQATRPGDRRNDHREIARVNGPHLLVVAVHAAVGGSGGAFVDPG